MVIFLLSWISSHTQGSQVKKAKDCFEKFEKKLVIFFLLWISLHTKGSQVKKAKYFFKPSMDHSIEYIFQLSLVSMGDRI